MKICSTAGIYDATNKNRHYPNLANLTSPKPLNLLFVVGYPRSGTTLLAKLLQDSTGYLAAPETALYEEHIPVLFRNSPIHVKSSLKNKLRLKNFADDFSWLNSRNTSAAAILDGLLNQFVARSPFPATGVIEKSPAHQYHTHKIQKDFPTSPIIYIARHPAMAISSVRGMHWTGKHLFSQILEWKYRTRKSIKDIKAGRIQKVSYEQLVVAPEDTIKEVLFKNNLKETTTAVAGSNLLIARGEASWKEKALFPPDPSRATINPSNLSKKQQNLIELICAEEMQYLGYQSKNINGRYFSRILLLYPIVNRALRYFYFRTGTNKLFGKPDLGHFP